MQIFLSYASENRDQAKEIAYAVKTAGHTVFFDRDQLGAGQSYYDVIRSEIDKSDCMVFLISPYSIEKKSYTLSELQIAKGKWPNPVRRVLPVMLEETNWDDIPAYLSAVTVLEPEGNVAAEIESAISNWVVKPPVWAIASLLVAVAGGIAISFNLTSELVDASPLVGDHWIAVPTAILLVVAASLALTVAFWWEHIDTDTDEESLRKDRRLRVVLIVFLVLAGMSVATSILAYRDMHPAPTEIFEPDL